VLQQLGRTVSDLRLRMEAVARRDEHGHLQDPLDAIERSSRGLQLRERVDRAVARLFDGVLNGDVSTDQSETRQSPVAHGHLSRHPDETAVHDGRHVRGDGRRRFRKLDPERRECFVRRRHG
jgi:hypothetical protein